MSDARLITAIGRIERALSRIEARSRSPGGEKADDLKVLEDRHHQLRARTQSAIDRLDRLIGTNGTAGGNGASGGG